LSHSTVKIDQVIYQYSLVVSKKMKNVLLFAEILPLFIFYLFFADPDSMIWFSLTYLGKLVAVLIILFYTDLHWIYGFFICVCIILYYQSDLIEGMQIRESMLSNTSITNMVEGFEPIASEPKVDSYSFLSDFIYEDTGSPNQKILMNITELKLKTQEEITYPKASDEWVYGIWKTWFIEDHSPPYPVSAKTIISPGSYAIVQ
jgi:hypothetical protein